MKIVDARITLSFSDMKMRSYINIKVLQTHVQEFLYYLVQRIKKIVNDIDNEEL